MTWETVSLEVDGRGVGLLVLDRPEKHNAMNDRMISELRLAIAAIREDSRIRVVVLTGAGKSFCAGADLRWMEAQATGDRQGRITEARSLATMLGDLNELDKPVIARVNGNAFGGALGLISVADIVVASDTARFGFTEVRLGLIPATIGPYVVARMGEGRARRVFFSGRLFGAGEAGELGLVGRVATPAGLDEAVEEEVAPFLSAAPGAVSRAKALVRELSPHAGRAATETTITRLADTWETAEAAEGIRAFFDKRPPPWAVAGE